MIEPTGHLDLNGFSQSLWGLTLRGGRISTGAGSLSFPTELIVAASDRTAIIDGRLLGIGNSGNSTPFNAITVENGPQAVDLEIPASISTLNNQPLRKFGPGQVLLSGSSTNTLTAELRFRGGTLILNKSLPDIAVRGNLAIGYADGAAAPFTDPTTLRLGNNEQIAALTSPANTVTIYDGSVFDLNGFTETISILSFMRGAELRSNGGSLTTATLNLFGGAVLNAPPGGLRVNGGVVVPAQPASPMLPVITGALRLGGSSTFFNVLDDMAGDDLLIDASLEGAGFRMFNAGQIHFAGPANTYTGTTTIHGGTLVLDKPDPDGAIRGNLVIGDGAGADVVRLDRPDQILDALPNTVTIAAGGLLDLDGFNETIGNLTLSGGTITTGNGILASTGVVSATTAATSTLAGKLSLAGARTFNTADTATLNLSAVVSNGSILKQGVGLLRLSAVNTFAGGITIADGRVLVGHDSALGIGPVFLDGGNIEPDGAALTLANAVTVNASANFAGNFDLTLTGPFSNPSGNGVAKSGTSKLTLSGPQNHAAGSSFDVIAGTLNLNSDAGSPGVANLNLRVTNASTRVQLGSTQHLNGLTLNDGKVTLAPGKLISTRTLSVDVNDATLDLATGAMLRRSDALTADADLAATIALISAARNAGRWDRPGITSSAAATHPGRATTLAAVLRSYLDDLPSPLAGEQVDPHSVLVLYTWYGDADVDFDLDMEDYAAIDFGFLSAAPAGPAAPRWTTGDFDQSGLIDADDYWLIDHAFLAQSGTPLAPPESSVVPEPACGAVAILLPALLTKRRRRRGHGEESQWWRLLET